MPLKIKEAVIKLNLTPTIVKAQKRKGITIVIEVLKFPLELHCYYY